VVEHVVRLLALARALARARARARGARAGARERAAPGAVGSEEPAVLVRGAARRQVAAAHMGRARGAPRHSHAARGERRDARDLRVR